jgi:hypothetical protein
MYDPAEELVECLFVLAVPDPGKIGRRVVRLNDALHELHRYRGIHLQEMVAQKARQQDSRRRAYRRDDREAQQ